MKMPFGSLCLLFLLNVLTGNSVCEEFADSKNVPEKTNFTENGIPVRKVVSYEALREEMKRTHGTFVYSSEPPEFWSLYVLIMYADPVNYYLISSSGKHENLGRPPHGHKALIQRIAGLPHDSTVVVQRIYHDTESLAGPTYFDPSDIQDATKELRLKVVILINEFCPCTRHNSTLNPIFENDSDLTATREGIIGVERASSRWVTYPDWPFCPEEAHRRQQETAHTLNASVEEVVDLGDGVMLPFILIPAGRFVMGTPTPVEPDWESIHYQTEKEQVIVVLGGVLIVIILFPIFWRSVVNWVLPQISLRRMLLLCFSIGIVTMGAMGWWQSLQTASGIREEYQVARARFVQADMAEKPSHTVTIPAPFFISKYEVTQAQFQKVLGKNPSGYNGTDDPVERVNWRECRIFCKEASRLCKRQLRLPSESEWEYACRAGAQTQYYHGDDTIGLKRNAWFSGNFGHHPVGQKEPNAFGLFDMLGNVYEWTEDDWHEYYFGAPLDGQPWIEHPRGVKRVARGGSRNGAIYARCSCRCSFEYYTRTDILGFRVVLDPFKD